MRDGFRLSQTGNEPSMKVYARFCIDMLPRYSVAAACAQCHIFFSSSALQTLELMRHAFWNTVHPSKHQTVS